jgi:branched-subunit amino acid transport protein AzlD
MADLNHEYLLVVTAIVAATTFATRVLPFLVFGAKAEQQGPLRYVGHYLPLMIMVILTIYAFKDVDWSRPSHGASELIGGATTAILQLTVRHVLLSIVMGVVVYALAGRWV